MGTIRKLLPLSGIIIFAYIVYATGPAKILAAFAGANPAYIALAIALIGVYMPVQTLKWKKIMELQGFRLNFLYLLKVYFIGMFYGMLTPGRIGTLLRISYIRDRTGRSFSECISNIVLDKLVDIFGLLLMGLVGFFLLLKYVSGAFFYVAVVFFAVFGAVFLLCMRRDLSKALMKIFYNNAIPQKYKKNAVDAFKSFYDKTPPVRYMILPSALMLVGWVISFSSSYIVLLALGVNTVPYHIFITISAVVMIITLIPITINGWGTREAALIAMLSIFGVTPEKIIVLGIITYVIGSVLPGAAGAIFAAHERGRKPGVS